MNRFKTVIVIILIFQTLVSCSKAPTSVEITEEMDKEISKYILDYNRDLYAKTEKQFEAHKIYGATEKKGSIYVYLYSLYGGFNKATKTDEQSGHSFPVLIVLKKKNDKYEVAKYQEPKDGSFYKSSIEKMFPEKYAKQALSDAGNIDDLRTELKGKVEKWLIESED